MASAITEAALADPVNGTIEIGGPETFRLDDAIRKVLEHDRDSREVIADPAAPYYGVQLTDRTLVPGAGARRGATTLEWWLVHVPPPANGTRRVVTDSTRACRSQ